MYDRQENIGTQSHEKAFNNFQAWATENNFSWIKVARPSIFVGTPSIFEPLIPK